MFVTFNRCSNATDNTHSTFEHDTVDTVVVVGRVRGRRRGREGGRERREQSTQTDCRVGRVE